MTGVQTCALPIWRNQVAGEAVYELHHAEPLVTAIGEITGTDVIGHPVFNARPKLPNQQLTVVPWHQDSGYFGAQSESALIPAAWIPLVPVDETNGCLQVVAGSHKIGLLNHHTEDREGQFLEVLDSLIDESQIITCPMEMGDALLFHNLTLHRSTVHTTSNMIRWAIDIRYVRGERDGVLSGRGTTEIDPLSLHDALPIGFYAGRRNEAEREARVERLSPHAVLPSDVQSHRRLARPRRVSYHAPRDSALG